MNPPFSTNMETSMSRGKGQRSKVNIRGVRRGRRGYLREACSYVKEEGTGRKNGLSELHRQTEKRDRNDVKR